MSADGTAVAYTSGASDLVPNDTNNGFDVSIAIEVYQTSLLSFLAASTKAGCAQRREGAQSAYAFH